MTAMMDPRLAVLPAMSIHIFPLDQAVLIARFQRSTLVEEDATLTAIFYQT
jgi:hypothetical protein